MSILLVFTLGTLSIFWGHILFKKWFNHLSLYATIWMTMIVLYEMKLLPFIDLTVTTWFVIGGAFFSFLLGILTILTARSVFPSKESRTNKFTESALFLDGGKKIRFFLLFFSVIGLFSALQHWSVLLNHYGSIINIFLHAQEIYASRLTNEEVKGVLPYLWLFSYFGACLGGLYSAYKRRVTLISLIPMLAIVLNETARFTRSGILFGLLEFLISFILMRHYLAGIKRKNELSKPLVILTSVVVISITVLGASLVKIIRNPTDSIQGSTSTIRQLSSSGIISPSIYFYSASQVGVLNIYLRDDNENVPIGNSTFFLFYNFLTKFDVVNKPKIFQEGYYIPYWSNTATYLRDLHSDFGYSGTLIFPYLLGLLTTFFWYKFFENGNISYYIVLVHLFLITGISFFLLATRFAPWFYGLLLLIFLLPLIEKINRKNHSEKIINNV